MEKYERNSFKSSSFSAKTENKFNKKFIRPAQEKFTFSSYDVFCNIPRKLCCCRNLRDKLLERGGHQLDDELDIIRVIKRLRELHTYSKYIFTDN